MIAFAVTMVNASRMSAVGAHTDKDLVVRATAPAAAVAIKIKGMLMLQKEGASASRCRRTRQSVWGAQQA